MTTIFVSAGLFFLFIFLSGFRLNRTGRPHSTLVLTIHKFVGLGLAVYLGLTVYQVYTAAPLTPIQVAITIFTILLFVTNVVTGSLLSTNKSIPGAVSTLNKLLPYLTVVATGFMLILLLSAE